MATNEAYTFGRLDYSAGNPVSANRFMPGTALYIEWERGWMDAVRADPLLDEDEKCDLLGATVMRRLQQPDKYADK